MGHNINCQFIYFIFCFDNLILPYCLIVNWNLYKKRDNLVGSNPSLVTLLNNNKIEIYNYDTCYRLTLRTT